MSATQPRPACKLGFGDRKTSAPKGPEEVAELLGQIMSAALNNEVDLDNANVALNAATRIVEVMQADTRMKALAIATHRTIVSSKAGSWPLLSNENTAGGAA